MTSTEQDPKLRALVERYKVCWQVYPEWSRIGGERRQTGVAIELYGTHEPTGIVPTAGCKHCIPVMQALLTIADDLSLLAGRQLLSVRAHSGIEYALERGARPDIVVTLAFGAATDGPGGWEAPVQAAGARLRALGVRERSWRQGDEPSGGQSK